jgi:hypothetical protein
MKYKQHIIVKMGGIVFLEMQMEQMPKACMITSI